MSDKRHLFWPDRVSCQEGVIYGWKLDTAGGWVVCDVTPIHAVLPAPRSPIGLELMGMASRSSEGSNLEAQAMDGNLVVSVDGHGRPLVLSRHCHVQIVIYHPPDPSRLRFISLTPTLITSIAESDEKLTAQLHRLEAPLTSSASVKPRTDLQQAVEHINQSYQARKLLYAGSDHNSNAGSPPAYCNAVLQRLDKLAQLIARNAISTHLAHIADLSITGRQIATRARQVLDMPSRFHEIIGRSRPIRETSTMYISFYNTVWLIANDIIVGWTIGSLLRDFATPVAHHTTRVLRMYAVDAIIAGLNWLDDWPVGLKLVTPVSKLYCGSLTDLALIWGSAIDHAAPFAETGIIVLSWISCLGGTFFLAVLGDCFALATAHLWLSRWLTSLIYRWELGSLYSLWNLFRGKRWNDSRQRIDDYDYQVDQLYLGTLFFTIAIFLLPTISVYHIYFATISAFVLLAQGIIEVAMTFMNQFPLFALVLRFKEPSRLPAGTLFELDGTNLRLRNQPASLQQIFGSFLTSWQHLTTKYSLFGIAKKAAKGSL